MEVELAEAHAVVEDEGGPEAGRRPGFEELGLDEEQASGCGEEGDEGKEIRRQRDDGLLPRGET